MSRQVCESKFCYFNIASELTEDDKRMIQNIYCQFCNVAKYCSQRCLQQDSISHSQQCKKNSDNFSTSTLSVNKKQLSDYEILSLPGKKAELGRGSYGAVKLVKEKKTGQKYAMKVISKKTIFQYCSVENLKREIKIQKKLQHPHITKLHHYFEDKENVYLILEYAENGSLFYFLRKKKRISEKEAFVYFFQTCLGIDYLHKKGIIHRDLKPENLLLDNEGNIKLCDFGWSAEAFSNQKRTTFCGTIDYMSPEMIKNEPHDHTLDIWCLGILLFELINGDAPFQGTNDHQKCQNIIRGQPINFDSCFSSSCKDLIFNILKQKPQDRLTMNQIFNHPWMKQMEKTYKIQIDQYIYKDSSNVSNKPSYEAQKNVSPQSQIPYSKDLYKNQSAVYSSQQNNKKQIEMQSQQLDPYLKKYNIENDREINLYNKLESKLDNKYQSSNNYYGQSNQYRQNNNKYQYMEDQEFKTRVSRVSQRNNLLESQNKFYNSNNQEKKQEEEGFFNKILGAFGCINRENKNEPPKDSNMPQKPKQQKYQQY